jgi:hypothetical protein
MGSRCLIEQTLHLDRLPGRRLAGRRHAQQTQLEFRNSSAVKNIRPVHEGKIGVSVEIFMKDS